MQESLATSWGSHSVLECSRVSTPCRPGRATSIRILSAGFGGLVPQGALAPGSFALGVADTAAPQLIYDPATATLAWDADNTGRDAVVAFAVLANKAALGAVDIVVLGSGPGRPPRGKAAGALRLR